MTEIFLAIPLMVLEEQIDSPAIIKQMVKRIDASLNIQHVLWVHFNSERPSSLQQERHMNKCILQLAPSHKINYHELKQNSLKFQLQQYTLSNIKQDLCELMKSYQQLKRQNKKLLKKLNQSLPQKENSGFSKSLNMNYKDDSDKYKDISIPEKDISIVDKQKSLRIEEPLSISLEVNSKINSEHQKPVNGPCNQNVLKNRVKDLQMQIGSLTRDNLQLKNIIVYYESRLLFVSEYLKKVEEQKQKQKKQSKQGKRKQKLKD